MFGLFSRKPKPPTYHVWQNDAARWSGIWKSVEGRTGDGRLVFVVHFDETLNLLHELLEQEGVIAIDLDRVQQPADLCKLPPGLYVLRAPLMVEQRDNKTPIASTPLKIVAIEPHLMPEPDTMLKLVLGSIRGDVLYEHHVSLDDLLLRMFAAERTLTLLSNAGFTEDDSLHSPLVSRAIHRAQTKIAESPGIDPSAQSYAAWEGQLPSREAP